MNVSMKQPHRHRDKFVVTKGEGRGEGRSQPLGLADINQDTQDR